MSSIRGLATVSGILLDKYLKQLVPSAHETYVASIVGDRSQMLRLEELPSNDAGLSAVLAQEAALPIEDEPWFRTFLQPYVTAWPSPLYLDLTGSMFWQVPDV